MGGRTRTGRTRCLITGKMIDKPKPGVDPINPKRLPYEVMVSETARLAQEMAELRKRWAGMEQPERFGHKGREICREYRHMSVKFKELTGQEPVRVYADQ